MQPTRPDPKLKFLAATATVAYVVVWIGMFVVLVGLPLAWIMARPNWYWGLPGEVSLPTATPAPAHSAFEGLTLRNITAHYHLPVAAMSVPVLGLLWGYTAARFSLALAFIYQLRAVLRRARDGAPFAPSNAERLTRLGSILIGIFALDGVAGFVTSLLISSGPVGLGLRLDYLDARLLLLAVVLYSLASVFKRGADLEHEQSLVV